MGVRDTAGGASHSEATYTHDIRYAGFVGWMLEVLKYGTLQGDY